MSTQPPSIVGEIRQNSTVHGISLISGNQMLLGIRAGDQIANLGIGLNFGVQIAVDPTEPTVFAGILGAKVDCLAKDDNRLVAVITCLYSARFKMKDLETFKKFSEDNLVEYIAGVTPQSAWPYIREHVQTMAARMMLPTVTLPYVGTVLSHDLALAQFRKALEDQRAITQQIVAQGVTPGPVIFAG